MSLAARLAEETRVCITLPRWLGDGIEVEPVVAAVARHVGESRLSLFAEGGVKKLYELAYPNVLKTTPSAKHHDVALLFRHSFSSAYRAWTARVPRRVGWARDFRRFMLTDALVPSRERGKLPLGRGVSANWPRFLPRSVGDEAAELAGLLGIHVERRAPRFEPSPAAETWAREHLEEHPRAIVVNLGARAGSSKGFPPTFAGRLIDALVEADADVVCIAAPKEHAVAMAGRDAARYPVPLIEPDLDQLLALCRHAALVITPDGGVRHMASIMGAKRVVAFASTDARHSVRAGIGDETSFEARIACGPCHLERCPKSGLEQLACWQELVPEELAAAAIAKL